MPDGLPDAIDTLFTLAALPGVDRMCLAPRAACDPNRRTDHRGVFSNRDHATPGHAGRGTTDFSAQRRP